jgi:predicted TIM-barrel fold metal-dependent hydrolase
MRKAMESEMSEPFAPAARATPLIDCDVHPLIKDINALEPYLSAHWREHFRIGKERRKSDNSVVYARARDRYNHPNATYRLDSVPPNGGPAGSDPGFCVTNHLDPYGITTALLLPQEHYGVARFGNPMAAAAYERANNEYLIDTWLPFDDRFTLCITVSEHDPKASAGDIRRLGAMPGVVGVQLLILQHMAGSAWFDPIYEAACEMELPIIFHQNGGEGCYSYSQVPAAGAARSYGERHAVLSQIGAANIMDMIVSGALERFPALKVVMVEWGFTWISWLMSRMDYLWMKNPNASGWIKRSPSEYIAEHFTFTTQPLDETTKSSEIAAMFGISNLDKMLLFSSDYPHYDTDCPSVIMNKIPRAMRNRVAYQNAVATFGPKIMRSQAHA